MGNVLGVVLLEACPESENSSHWFLLPRSPSRSNGALVNMTADAATLAAAEGAVADFLAALPAASNANGASGGWGHELLLPAANEALTVPTQVG